MTNPKYEQEIETIVRTDDRYRTGAYYFVADAVAYTTRKQSDGGKDVQGVQHISGRELLEGIRSYAIEQYGPLTLDVLKDWGITCTQDFGNIVFNLVEHRLLGASEEDSPEDFADGYDFRQAFLRPFAVHRNDKETPPKIA